MIKKKKHWFDWKIILIIVLILIVLRANYIYSSLSDDYDELLEDYNLKASQCYQNNVNCDAQLQDLHSRWQNAYFTLKNCFENGMRTCSTTIPSLD